MRLTRSTSHLMNTPQVTALMLAALRLNLHLPVKPSAPKPEQLNLQTAPTADEC